MNLDRKQRQETLIQQLKDRAGSFEVQTTIELLQVMLDGAKNNLLTCTGNDFNRVQGEAQTYDKLIRLLTRQSLSASK